MSRIVAFRGRIMDAVGACIPDFAEVDWWDGIFDEDDLQEWSAKTPAAYVSVTSVPTAHAATGELNTDLRCVIAVVENDRRRPRDADERLWDYLERLAVMVNLNRFGDPHSAPATAVKIRKLPDAELRREGTAIGVVDWNSGLKIGVNQVHKREYVYHPVTGERITQTPKDLFLGYASAHTADGRVAARERVDLTPSDPAFPGDPD